MFVQLPTPIAAYMDAIKRLDVEGMVQPFAPDGAVRDHGRRHQGHLAIRTWVQETSAADGTVFTPDTVCHETGRIVVEGVRTGGSDSGARRFVLTFDLEGDAIRTLEIG